ncbi:MAG: HAD-IIA family hydrolase [Propionibacteriaceae bacterium]|nr:HAD-IIA family hydrolase [Propionibacteriaceae bacterium]
MTTPTDNTPLNVGYDTIGFDLDGVIYRGPDEVPGAAGTLAALRAQGTKIGFVTNNAQRSPETVAAHLRRLGIKAASADVVTSAQAIARVMAREMAPGSPVLVIGSEALTSEITGVGLAVTSQWRDAAAIVVGFDPEQTWENLNDACFAVQRGATWYACNDDATRPTDEGIAIGMGGILAAMTNALPDDQPIIAGKPFRPLLDETIARLGAQRMLFVGDRLDTDIEGAHNINGDSLFVLSGSHGKRDLIAAPPHQHPTTIGADITALLEPARLADSNGGDTEVRCRQQIARRAADGALTLATEPQDVAEQLDALWAVAVLAWRQPADGRLDASAALERLPDLR